MNKERIQLLLQKYADNEASETEIREMLGTLREEGADAELESFILKIFNEAKENPIVPVDWKAIWDNINKRTQQAPVKKMAWMRVAAAAIIVLCLSLGGYFYFNKTLRQAQRDNLVKNDVAPGGNKAILTLANGKQIILDSAHNGTITQQGNTKVIKLDSGQLAYSGNGNEILYNTITTPKGGQYQIVLADGSKVWLNAASSLHFPTSFSKDRNVELTGEGYFEVVHNAAKPFTVSVNGITVEDLGTHFNINAYSDEAVIKTTLLEGSVKVSTVRPSSGSGQAQSTVLRPGQQAILRQAQDDKEIKVITADLDEAVAWKNGRFIFQGNNIQSVMRQLARWYDVEVNYQGNVTDEEFVGVINRSRYENISQVLNMLEKTKTVSFAINGKSITVMPFKK